MKPRCIGIIGGAGPLAGAYLLERILILAGQMYGCYRDADFPKIFLLSFPFSEMLNPARDDRRLRQELNECLMALRQQGATVLAIACNTLHAFLEEEVDGLVHLPRTLAEESFLEKPLMFCTSTSAQCRLHQQFLPSVRVVSEKNFKIKL